MDDTGRKSRNAGPKRAPEVGDRVLVPSYDDQPGTVTSVGRLDLDRPLGVLLDDEDEPRKFNVDEVEPAPAGR